MIYNLITRREKNNYSRPDERKKQKKTGTQDIYSFVGQLDASIHHPREKK